MRLDAPQIQLYTCSYASECLEKSRCTKNEDEMVGWHHQLNGHEFEQPPRDSEGSLACCDPRGHKESDMTE